MVTRGHTQHYFSQSQLMKHWRLNIECLLASPVSKEGCMSCQRYISSHDIKKKIIIIMLVMMITVIIITITITIIIFTIIIIKILMIIRKIPVIIIIINGNFTEISIWKAP